MTPKRDTAGEEGGDEEGEDDDVADDDDDDDDDGDDEFPTERSWSRYGSTMTASSMLFRHPCTDPTAP
jgi:hypothetical protein